MTNEERLLALAVELLTTFLHEDVEAFLDYANARLPEAVATRSDADLLVAVLVVLAGSSLAEWAESTAREPEALLQVLALDLAQQRGGA